MVSHVLDMKRRPTAQDRFVTASPIFLLFALPRKMNDSDILCSLFLSYCFSHCTTFTNRMLFYFIFRLSCVVVNFSRMKPSELVEVADDTTLMVRTLEILWHCNQRSNEAEQMGLRSCVPEGITSIDWNSAGSRLLTTGGDKCIRIWELNLDALAMWMKDGTKDMTACVQHISCMQSSWMPMTARWSPHDQLVASAHCDGKICLWWQERSMDGAISKDENGEEVWKDFRHLSGHVNDVYDICFSPDSRYLLSAGGDGCILIHDLEGSTMPVVQLSGCHTKFCRGVAWDPWNRFVATFGGGPSLQFFSHVPKRVSESVTRRMALAGQRKAQGEFIGDACSLFFRRLSWSPDGMLLAVPFGKAGHVSQVGREGGNRSNESQRCVDNDMVHCINIYARASLEKVAARIVVRGYSEIRGAIWAPCFLEPTGPSKLTSSNPSFRSSDCTPSSKLAGEEVIVEPLREKELGLWGPKAYRMALAAWTPDAVIVYTTGSCIRHSDFTDLHIHSITDVAWAPDASYILTAALDGYVSVIAFQGTLSTTHRLPMFVPSRTVRSMCDVFSGLRNIGAEVESSYSRMAPQVSQPTVATVVKKKKRIPTAEELLQRIIERCSLSSSFHIFSGMFGAQASNPQMSLPMDSADDVRTTLAQLTARARKLLVDEDNNSVSLNSRGVFEVSKRAADAIRQKTEGTGVVPASGSQASVELFMARNFGFDLQEQQRLIQQMQRNHMEMAVDVTSTDNNRSYGVVGSISDVDAVVDAIKHDLIGHAHCAVYQKEQADIELRSHEMLKAAWKSFYITVSDDFDGLSASLEKSFVSSESPQSMEMNRTIGAFASIVEEYPPVLWVDHFTSYVLEQSSTNGNDIGVLWATVQALLQPIIRLGSNANFLSYVSSSREVIERKFCNRLLTSGVRLDSARVEELNSVPASRVYEMIQSNAGGNPWSHAYSAMKAGRYDVAVLVARRIGATALEEALQKYADASPLERQKLPPVVSLRLLYAEEATREDPFRQTVLFALLAGRTGEEEADIERTLVDLSSKVSTSLEDMLWLRLVCIRTQEESPQGGQVQSLAFMQRAILDDLQDLIQVVHGSVPRLVSFLFHALLPATGLRLLLETIPYYVDGLHMALCFNACNLLHQGSLESVLDLERHMGRYCGMMLLSVDRCVSSARQQAGSATFSYFQKSGFTEAFAEFCQKDVICNRLFGQRTNIGEPASGILLQRSGGAKSELWQAMWLIAETAAKRNRFATALHLLLAVAQSVRLTGGPQKEVSAAVGRAVQIACPALCQVLYLPIQSSDAGTVIAEASQIIHFLRQQSDPDAVTATDFQTLNILCAMSDVYLAAGNAQWETALGAFFQLPFVPASANVDIEAAAQDYCSCSPHVVAAGGAIIPLVFQAATHLLEEELRNSSPHSGEGQSRAGVILRHMEVVISWVRPFLVIRVSISQKCINIITSNSMLIVAFQHNKKSIENAEVSSLDELSWILLNKKRMIGTSTPDPKRLDVLMSDIVRLYVEFVEHLRQGGEASVEEFGHIFEKQKMEYIHYCGSSLSHPYHPCIEVDLFQLGAAYLSFPSDVVLPKVRLFSLLLLFFLFGTQPSRGQNDLVPITIPLSIDVFESLFDNPHGVAPPDSSQTISSLLENLALSLYISNAFSLQPSVDNKEYIAAVMRSHESHHAPLFTSFSNPVRNMQHDILKKRSVADDDMSKVSNVELRTALGRYMHHRGKNEHLFPRMNRNGNIVFVFLTHYALWRRFTSLIIGFRSAAVRVALRKTMPLLSRASPSKFASVSLHESVVSDTETVCVPKPAPRQKLEQPEDPSQLKYKVNVFDKFGMPLSEVPIGPQSLKDILDLAPSSLLQEELRKLFEKRRWRGPTSVQSITAPLVLQRYDLLTIAPPATGKTFAYIFPSVVSVLLSTSPNRALEEVSSISGSDIEELMQDKIRRGEICKYCELDVAQHKICPITGTVHPEPETAEENGAAERVKDIGNVAKPRILVLVPTSTLAQQVHKAFTEVKENLSVRYLVRASSAEEQKKHLNAMEGADVLVSTPETLLAPLMKGRLSFARVKIAILDEVDELVSNNHFDAVKMIFGALPKGHRRPQRLLFGASLPQTVYQMLRQRFLHPTHRFVLVDNLRDKTSASSTAKNLVKHSVFLVGQVEKIQKLLWLYRTEVIHADQRTIVFCNSRHNVMYVADRLKALMPELHVTTLSAKASITAKTATLKMFSSGVSTCLVCTDILSRGMDFTNVVHVIHYDMPADMSTWIHRSGRCGRNGRHGYTYSLFQPENIKLAKPLTAFLRENQQFVPPKLQEYGRQSFGDLFNNSLFHHPTRRYRRSDPQHHAAPPTLISPSGSGRNTQLFLKNDFLVPGYTRKRKNRRIYRIYIVFFLRCQTAFIFPMAATAPKATPPVGSTLDMLPPEPTASHKRMMDFNVTAYPSRVNEQLLPERALKEKDFSAIDPLQYRKNHEVKNNNVSSGTSGGYREPGLEMMSSSHLANHFMLMGQELSKNSTGNTKAFMPRGYFTKYISPPFDERSTYRLDYCQDEADGFQDVTKFTLENYRNDWTEEEKANIDVSKNIPYLTLPESHCNNRTTVYRYTMMPDLKKNEVRTISQHTNLPDLGASFAYSAYTEDDPRRVISYDPKIAALKHPKSFMEKAGEKGVFDPKKARAVHDELDRMRKLRRETMQKRRESSINSNERVEGATDSTDQENSSGTKRTNCRTGPRDNTDYVFLPRDHFCRKKTTSNFDQLNQFNVNLASKDPSVSTKTLIVLRGTHVPSAADVSEVLDSPFASVLVSLLSMYSIELYSVNNIKSTIIIFLSNLLELPLVSHLRTMDENLKHIFREHENDANARLNAFILAQEKILSLLGSGNLQDSLCINEMLAALAVGAVDPWSRIRKAAITAIETVLFTLCETLPSELRGHVQSFLNELPEKYRTSKHWYEKEGLLHLLTLSINLWIIDKDFCSVVTHSITLLSLCAAELPVREAAATLLQKITSKEPDLLYSVEKQLFDHFESAGEDESEHAIHSLEGHLIALEKLRSTSVAEFSDDQLSALLKLGAHSAASVRLYVAEILRPPSELLFGLILQEIVEGFSSRAGECPLQKWKYYETIMMVLNNHLMYYLEVRCISFSRCLTHFRNPQLYSVRIVASEVVVSLLRGIDSKVFEMKRIATQVLPLFVQFYIRHVGSVNELCILYRSLANHRDACTRGTLKELFDQHTLPLMWWYLAIFVTVRHNSLRKLDKDVLCQNLKLKLYTGILKSNAATAHIALMIMCTYFPDWCSRAIFSEMLKDSSWRSILQRNGRKYIHFGIDFVRMMNQKGCETKHLIPVWAESLNGLMTHEQCIILTMIKDSLYPKEDARPFSFAYDFTYKAPVMVDGGEDTTLGYTWLHSTYPTIDSPPLFRILSPVSVTKKHFAHLPEGNNYLLALRPVFDTLYTSSGTEPPVLQKIRELMIFILKDTVGDNWCSWILHAVFTRLNSLSPSWKDNEENKDKVDEKNYDDWDDDDDDCVGFSAVEEKERAAVICKVLLAKRPSYSGEFAEELRIVIALLVVLTPFLSLKCGICGNNNLFVDQSEERSSLSVPFAHTSSFLLGFLIVFFFGGGGSPPPKGGGFELEAMVCFLPPFFLLSRNRFSAEKTFYRQAPMAPAAEFRENRKRVQRGIEPRTSPTLRENHATRPLDLAFQRLRRHISSIRFHLLRSNVLYLPAEASKVNFLEFEGGRGPGFNSPLDPFHALSRKTTYFDARPSASVEIFLSCHLNRVPRVNNAHFSLIDNNRKRNKIFYLTHYFHRLFY
eukprot:gene5171-3719_t